ncbi:MAG: DUF2628 domain-containing protein, partial [Alphaproteobacteria bacterium]|nr:DUF2628 domain-containing protein [Alphaproteobacteria bacterium]
VPYDNPQDMERARFVQEGFYWNACFFTVLWSLYHRLWLASAVLVLVYVAESMLVERLGLGMLSDLLIQLGISVIFGFMASDLLGRALRSRGYELADVVVSKNLTGAQHRFFERRLEERLEQKLNELPKAL